MVGPAERPLNAADPSRPSLAVHYHSLRPPHALAAASPNPAAPSDPLLRHELRRAALPHVVPQLLPKVWEHMLPLLGFFHERARASDAVAADAPRAPGMLRRRAAAEPAPRFGLVYADIGETLSDRYLTGEPATRGMSFVHVVRDRFVLGAHACGIARAHACIVLHLLSVVA